VVAIGSSSSIPFLAPRSASLPVRTAHSEGADFSSELSAADLRSPSQEPPRTAARKSDAAPKTPAEAGKPSDPRIVGTEARKPGESEDADHKKNDGVPVAVVSGTLAEEPAPAPSGSIFASGEQVAVVSGTPAEEPAPSPSGSIFTSAEPDDAPGPDRTAAILTLPGRVLSAEPSAAADSEGASAKTPAKALAAPEIEPAPHRQAASAGGLGAVSVPAGARACDMKAPDQKRRPATTEQSSLAPVVPPLRPEPSPDVEIPSVAPVGRDHTAQTSNSDSSAATGSKAAASGSPTIETGSPTTPQAAELAFAVTFSDRQSDTDTPGARPLADGAASRAVETAAGAAAQTAAPAIAATATPALAATAAPALAATVTPGPPAGFASELPVIRRIESQPARAGSIDRSPDSGGTPIANPAGGLAAKPLPGSQTNAPEGSPEPARVAGPTKSTAAPRSDTEQRPSHGNADTSDRPAGTDTGSQTPQPAAAPAPATSSQPPASEVAAPRRADAAVKPETLPAQDAETNPTAQRSSEPLRDISIRLAGDGDSRVDVRLTDRAGELRIEVRTPDAHLTRSLRDGLPELAERLETTGRTTQVWRPADSGTSLSDQRARNPQGQSWSSQSQNNPRHNSQSGNEGGRRGRQNPQEEPAGREEAFAAYLRQGRGNQ
jgi:hypothetical protein